MANQPEKISMEIDTEIDGLMDKMLTKSFGLLMYNWDPEIAELHRLNLRMAAMLIVQRNHDQTKSVSPTCNLDNCSKAKRVD